MNEKERLEELYSYDILDTPPEKFLDELIEIASLIFKTPVSLITLIDKDREWYKAAKGTSAIIFVLLVAILLYCRWFIKRNK